MPWQHIRISRFGGPEVLELAEQPTLPEPGPDEVRIKVLAAGTGFTDTFIRRGRYPDFKGPLPFTPGYDLVGVVEQTGRGVTELRQGQVVADLCVIGGYAQYAIRPARFLVTVPDGVDPAEAVCIPLAYLTAFQMLTRYRRLLPGATILVIGASGTVGTALLDLARHLGLKAIGTCSAANLAAVERFGAIAIDYRAGDFVAAVRRLTASHGGAGVDAAFDAIGGAHFNRSFACLASGGLFVGLRVADHGGWFRRLSFRSTRPGPDQALGRATSTTRISTSTTANWPATRNNGRGRSAVCEQPPPPGQHGAGSI